MEIYRASVENILPKLKMLGIDVKLIDAYAFPFDKKEFIDEIKNSRYILTIEDNVLSGGLGSLVFRDIIRQSSKYTNKKIRFVIWE